MPGRLLVITALWPTSDQPAAGIFVQRRLEGIDATVIGPQSYLGAMPRRYVALAWRALTTRGRYTAVEAHVLFPTGLIGWLAARLRRIPLIVYAHGADVRNTAHQNRVYWRLASFVARHADAVATNSAATAELVIALGGQPHVIPPGVDRDAFQPTPVAHRGRSLYLGGSDPRKAPQVGMLAGTVAGPGIRPVKPHDVPALMAAHDIVLVPSHREPFGLVAAEAICAGRWVVARDVDGLREIVTDGVNGTLVADGDFAGALARVPTYDPFAVAATGERFDWTHHRTAMNALAAETARRYGRRRAAM